MTENIIQSIINIGSLTTMLYLVINILSLKNNMDFLKSKMDDILKEKEGGCDDKKIYQKNPWKKKTWD